METVLPIPFIIIFIFILALISFFFSASETAVIGLSRIRLRHMIAKGIRRAKNIQQLIKKLDKFIAAILIGNDLMNIAIASIVTAIFVQIFGYRLGVVIATFTSAFFILLVCEITPKILATKHTEKIALFTAPIMQFFIKLFHPVIIIFTRMSNFILKVLGLESTKKPPLITEEELRHMIDVGREEGVLSEEELKMLQCIFKFGDTQAANVMVPKDKIVAVNINSTPEELLNIFAEEGHSRIPVYEGTIDNIIGIIYSRDILYTLRDRQLFILSDLVNAAYYVPAAMKVSELLIKFQKDKIQIAIVVDENKKTLGLATLEDLIEEIVGEIEEVQ